MQVETSSSDRNVGHTKITNEQNEVSDEDGGDGVAHSGPDDPVAHQQTRQQKEEMLSIHILVNDKLVFL